MELDTRITVRLTQQQWRRLCYLEEQTKRTKSNVLRLLLDAAQPTGAPDIKLDERRLNYGERT